MRIQLVQLQFSSTIARELAYYWLQANNIKVTRVNETWVDAEDVELYLLNKLNTILENLAI